MNVSLIYKRLQRSLTDSRIDSRTRLYSSKLTEYRDIVNVRILNVEDAIYSLELNMKEMMSGIWMVKGSRVINFSK